MSFFGNQNIGVGQIPATVMVSASSTEIIASNSARAFAVLTNLGKEDVWVACDTTALINKGFLLGKNGGNLALDATILTKGPINGITKAGKISAVTFQDFNNG